ncbi:MAG: DUF4878 domain-containing protein [Bacteroidales bacterium]|jgi:uncharacterized protein YqgV (UPF0045/DUF77 family)|nr:DUF4878 domain-containing protein [Bacteroidales bacterium]
MKKLSILMAICAFVFASCGGGSNTPSGTVKTFFKAMEAKEFEKALGCMGFNSETDKEETAALVEKMEKSAEEEGSKMAFKDYEILSETIAEDGNSATVKLKITTNDGKTEENEIKLKKVEEKWVIDLGK